MFIVEIHGLVQEMCSFLFSAVFSPSPQQIFSMYETFTSKLFVQQALKMVELEQYRIMNTCVFLFIHSAILFVVICQKAFFCCFSPRICICFAFENAHFWTVLLQLAICKYIKYTIVFLWILNELDFFHKKPNYILRVQKCIIGCAFHYDLLQTLWFRRLHLLSAVSLKLIFLRSLLPQRPRTFLVQVSTQT